MKSEFKFIQDLKKKYSLDKIGDDCAVLPKDNKTDMVVTADMLVEDIDFRLDWTTPEFLGHKALAVSLSDIAAMGAEPKWAMLSIGIPKHLWKTDFLDRFYEGWHALARKFEVELVGGDVSRSPDKFIADSIVSGSVQKGKAILRSTANRGDKIYVSGSLGGAAGGLKLLERGMHEENSNDEKTSALIERQLKPIPRLELAASLRDIASAMIDISDGFSSDLHHLCEASGFGGLIGNLSVDTNLYGPFENEQAIQLALHGGEDFELLFTVPQEKIFGLKDLPVTRVGIIGSVSGNIELIRGAEKTILQPKGYRHF